MKRQNRDENTELTRETVQAVIVLALKLGRFVGSGNDIERLSFDLARV